MANEIIPFNGRALSKQEQTGGAVTFRVTEAVKQVMREVIVCYAAPGETTEDRALVVGVWARETAEYPQEVVQAAFRYLLRHNPRAPWRPSLKDIIDRCDWEMAETERTIHQWYKGGNCAEPPAWSKPLVRKALAKVVVEFRSKHVSYNGSPNGNGYKRDGLSDQDFLGWKLAKEIGNRVNLWPHDLLDEFGVYYGDKLEAVAKRIADIEAERARREEEQRAEREKFELERWEQQKREAKRAQLTAEAREAALARPDVAEAKKFYEGCYAVRSNCEKTTQAHNAFVKLFMPAMNEELAKRGLPQWPWK